MLIAVAAVVVGVAVLAFAADQFVLGAARIALAKHVPSIVVGVVIIGFGTSAPELIVSTIAAAGGTSEVAIGNVVGSNIANLSLLLGVGALMIPLTVDSRTVKREAPMVVAAVLLFGAAVQGGGISRLEGLGLLVALAAALVMITRRSPGNGAGADPLGTDAEELADDGQHLLKTEALRTIVGLVGTLGGAQLLLWGALDIADRANLAEGFVGVTMVAIGTSLPELVTVIQSARRRETDLIVGNLLGSNLFNALGVGGVVGLIGAPSIDSPELTTIAASAAVGVAVLALGSMITRQTVSRKEGAFLIVAYFALVPFLA